jgi:hypothetical protein
MDTLAILIAVLALVVSVATLYYQSRQPRLSLIPGENLALSYDRDGRLVFVLGVTITNAGARLGVVLRLHGRLKSPGFADETLFAWHAFADSSDAGTLETAFSPIGTVNAWVHTLVVPGMGAEVKRVVFRTSNPFKAVAGELTITMHADAISPVSPVSECYSLTVGDVLGIDDHKPSADQRYHLWFVKRTPRPPAGGSP